MGVGIRQSVADVDTDSLLSQNWPPSLPVHWRSCSETDSATTEKFGRIKTEKIAWNAMEFLISVDLGKVWPPLFCAAVTPASLSAAVQLRWLPVWICRNYCSRYVERYWVLIPNLCGNTLFNVGFLAIHKQLTGSQPVRLKCRVWSIRNDCAEELHRCRRLSSLLAESTNAFDGQFCALSTQVIDVQGLNCIELGLIKCHCVSWGLYAVHPTFERAWQGYRTVLPTFPSCSQ